MNKPFLLIAGNCYYPCSGTKNWIGCYETEEEALALIEEGTYCTYKIGQKDADWYDIVDLRDWTDNNK